MKDKYRVVFDTYEYCGSLDTYDDLDSAIMAAQNVYYDWMSETTNADDWNDMVDRCWCLIEEYDEERGEWEIIWEPSEGELRYMNFVHLDEMEPNVHKFFMAYLSNK